MGMLLTEVVLAILNCDPQVSAIESLLAGAGVAQVIGWINDEVDENTTQEDIDAKVRELIDTVF